MANIKTTTMSPSTCGCHITYQYDDDLPDESKIFSMVSIQRCVRHSSIMDASVFTAVMEENDRWGKVLQQLEEGNLPDLNWRFTSTGILEIQVPGNANIRRTWQTRANNLVGPNKVLVVPIGTW